MNTILTILQWAIPSGGIGAAIAWIANRRLRSVEEKKKVEDTYKQMYDMVSEELLKFQKQSKENYAKMEELRSENDKTRRALNRLSRAVEAIQFCPYRADCPIRHELSIDTDSSAGKTDADKRQRSKGQHKRAGKDAPGAAHPGGDDQSNGVAGQPGPASH